MVMAVCCVAWFQVFEKQRNNPVLINPRIDKIMRKTRFRWQGGRILAAALMVGMLPAVLEAQQQRPERPRPNPNGRFNREQAEAREIFQALQNLSNAVERDQTRLRANTTSVERPQKTVTPPTLTSVALDQLIASTVGRPEGPETPITDDPTFIRRLSLDLTGVPPTESEIDAFVDNQAPDKRAQLVDRLLETEAYATNWARYWRDVIRYRATFPNIRLVNYPELEAWLTEQFSSNRPWDEIATELISGTGTTQENGQVAFTVAHLEGNRRLSPPEFAGEVSRVFMGIQLQCAQCHDHPTDPWTREQFHQFASFFAGVNTRRIGQPQDPDYGVGVEPSRRIPRYTMPDLDDPTTSIPVEPKFFLASEEVPNSLNTQERRELAASYVVGQDNPWFARAFVNRLWYELNGDSFYMPIDDIGPARDPIAAEVIETVAEQWQAGGYDIKWLLRTILNTETYQRDSKSSFSAASGTPFAANCPSRLRADQIVDVLDQALGLFTAARRAAEGRGERAKRFARIGPRINMDQVFGVDPSIPDDEVLGTIPQALFLMNGRQIEQSIVSPRGILTGLLREHPDHTEAINALYLRVLARAPNDEERKLCLDYINDVDDRREAFEDILWSLVNSAEFISRY